MSKEDDRTLERLADEACKARDNAHGWGDGWAGSASTVKRKMVEAYELGKAAGKESK